ncbi:MAG: hypothetical protein JW741_22300 [Sedimentisphaerales bacterium]|nr:hypothetical protein [Sedimentisphaerales bacterium]
MIGQQKESVLSAGMPSEEPNILPFTPLKEIEHLLKVSGSVCEDANKVWAEIWGELKGMATGGGMVVPEAAEGFVPSCGWPEFLEKVWLLKHYLDSIQRICARKH